MGLLISTAVLVQFIMSSISDNKYLGNIKREIEAVSDDHASWIKGHCGVKALVRRRNRSLNSPTFKIYGGVPTENYQYPWAIGIQSYIDIYWQAKNGRIYTVPERSIRHCTGSLISNRHILSAQHCFITKLEVEKNGKKDYIPYNYNETYFKANITVGKGNKRADLRFETTERSRYILNTNFYDGRKEFDWVLVELENRVPERYFESKAIVPICLPKVDDVVNANNWVDVYGQGLYKEGAARETETTMRYGYTTIDTVGKPMNSSQTIILLNPDFKSGHKRHLKLSVLILDLHFQGDSGGGLTKRYPIFPKPTRPPLSRDVLVGIPVCVPTINNITRTMAVDVRTISNCITTLTNIQPDE